MTIAQQLKVKEFPFEIKDSKGNVIYHEKSFGYWERREYDVNSNISYSESSHGWTKYEHDANGNEIYYESSLGVVMDNRPKIDV
jgi:hypothetical protein